MRRGDTRAEAALREDIRSFVRARFPAGYTPDRDLENSLEPEDVLGYEWTSDRVCADPSRRAAARAWAAALAERGWISPRLPVEHGGAGFTPRQELVLQEELMRAGVPTVNGIAAYLLAPTILEHGTAELRARHLPGIADGTVAWAQGFSEPDAGSDLASLRSTATRRGDHYVVNGQKVWTSLAQFADWLFVLVRTDPKRPRHRGLSVLLIDAHTPGITIRPITDLRGAQPFTEIFLDDVRVPVTDRLGAEHDGWRVAMTSLSYERAGIGATIKYHRVLDRLAQAVRDGTEPRLRADQGALRREIAQRHVEIRVLHDLARYTVDRQADGRVPGYESSASLLFSAGLNQRLARTGMSAFGEFGGVWQRDDAPLDGLFAHLRLDSVASFFLGGATAVQRHIIACRGLGLPRS